MDARTGHEDEWRLAEIERELAVADPDLAAALSTLSPVRRLAWSWVALAVAGLGLLVVGLLVGSAPMAVLGAGCAFAGSVVAGWRSSDEGWFQAL
jgi:ferric-dicitrate binding protein FerR (iron transport regulator)